MTKEIADVILKATTALYNESRFKEALDLKIAYYSLKNGSTIAMTAEFMHAAGQACPDKPIQPYEDEHEDIFRLRLILCLEELGELAEALGMKATFQKMLLEKGGASYDHSDYRRDYYNGTYIETGEDTGTYDPVAVLDALADMRVVADGTILACGLQHIFPAAMAEVYASNMSKFPENEQLARDTVSEYTKNGIYAQYYPVKGNSRFVVIRSADNKVLKSLNYAPANLAPLLAVS